MDPLLIERRDQVTQLVLNRPDKRNALSARLVEDLLLAMRATITDGTRLVVIRGNGSAFCAGFDFSAIDKHSDGDLALRFLKIEQLLQALRHAPFPTLALAHGPCYGAGADVFAACAQRVVAPGAVFRMPGLRFGVVLGTRRLAELVGTDSARALLRDSRVFNAEEAVALGFADAIRPTEEWPAVIDKARSSALSLAPSAQQAMLERTAADTRDSDMAALARSVAEPGLRDRILAFLGRSGQHAKDE